MVKIVEQTESRLVVEANHPSSGWVLFTLSMLAASITLDWLILGSRFTGQNLQWLSCVMIMLLFAFGASFEQTWFAFDRATRTLHWQHRYALIQRGDKVPFNEIQAVEVVTHKLEVIKELPRQRVTLHLATGDLPLTRAFVRDPGRMLPKLAAAIETFLAAEP